MKNFIKSIFKPATYIGGMLSFINWILEVIAGVFSFVGIPASKLIMKISGLSEIPRFGSLFKENHDYVADLKERYKDSDEPLLNGDLEQAAREAFPPEDYPEMWVNWRSDTNPGIIFDGKLINGENIKDLSWNYATSDIVNMAYERARKSSVEHFASLFIGMSIISLLFYFIDITFLGITIPGGHIDGTIINSFAALSHISGGITGFLTGTVGPNAGYSVFEIINLSVSFVNSFMSAENHALSRGYEVWGSPSAPYGQNFILLLALLVATVLNPFFIIIAYVSAKIKFNIEGARLLRKIVEKGGEAYRKQTKESVVSWLNNSFLRKKYLEDLMEAREKNEGYIKSIGFDGGIRIGRSTGYFMSMGMHQSNAMLPNKDVIFDGEAQTKNIIVIGETGGGKTTDVGIPLAMQLSKQVKRGFFIMDSKGVLWKQILKNLKKYNPSRLDKYIVIGTGSHDGKDNYGVDTLEGMDPSQVSDQFFSISNSMSVGGAGNDYFPQEAANIVENAARILSAYELTEAGMLDWDESNTRPYSILSILKFGTDEAFRLKVCGEIIASLSAERANAGNSYAKAGARILMSCDQEALLNNIYWMSYKGDGTMNGDTFPKMHDGQRSGVIGSFKKMLNFVYRNKEMRERFCRGRRSRDWENQNLIDVQDVFEGYLVCINLNIEKLGMVGLATARILKQRLYNMASIRQPILEGKGLNPQFECPVTLIIDEAQNFISATKDAGMDEGSAPNVLRSTGLSMIFMTQGYSALKKTIGEDNLNNFLNNFTNKVFLRNSDKETGDEVSRLVGPGQRMHAYHEGENENWLQVQSMYKTLTPEQFLVKYNESSKFRNSIDAMKIAEDKNDLMPAISSDKVYEAPDAYRDLAFTGMRKPTLGTLKGLLKNGNMDGIGGAGGGEDAGIGRESAYYQHIENMERRSRETGNQSEQIVDSGFMAKMKDHEAIVIVGQAGYVRMDLVKLDNAMY